VPDDLMFVYGTLRKDTASPMKPILDQFCDLVGMATMKGRLYDLGRYPGVVLDEANGDPVFGQLFRLTDPARVLSEFDYYEECSDDFSAPHLYRREKVQVTMMSGETVLAWVYLYNRSTSGHIHIPAGDYINYLAGKAS